MKTYSVLFAQDVPHYGVAHIEANDDAAALEADKAYDLSEVATDPEWENSVCKRIVYIEDQEGNTIINDVPLDNCDLQIRRRHRAPPMLMPHATCWTDRCNSARTCSRMPGSMTERHLSAPLTPRARRLPRRQEVQHEHPQ